MPFVTENGLRFHVQELGQGTTPVVMLHGLFIGSLANWLLTVAPGLAPSCRLLMYDLRGHGLSERPAEGYDIPTQARDLAAVADRLGPGPVAVVAHSFGGLIALRFALDHPERVSKLALVETPLPPFAGDLFVELIPDDLRQAMETGGRRVRRAYEITKKLATETSLLRDLQAEEAYGDEALAALEPPLLCIYGEDSRCRADGERLARVVPSAKLTLLPGGHFPMLTSPALLRGRLEEFLHA